MNRASPESRPRPGSGRLSSPQIPGSGKGSSSPSPIAGAAVTRAMPGFGIPRPGRSPGCSTRAPAPPARCPGSLDPSSWQKPRCNPRGHRLAGHASPVGRTGWIGVAYPLWVIFPFSREAARLGGRSGRRGRRAKGGDRFGEGIGPESDTVLEGFGRGSRPSGSGWRPVRNRPTRSPSQSSTESRECRASAMTSTAPRRTRDPPGGRSLSRGASQCHLP